MFRLCHFLAFCYIPNQWQYALGRRYRQQVIYHGSSPVWIRTKKHSSFYSSEIMYWFSSLGNSQCGKFQMPAAVKTQFLSSRCSYFGGRSIHFLKYLKWWFTTCVMRRPRAPQWSHKGYMMYFKISRGRQMFNICWILLEVWAQNASQFRYDILLYSFQWRQTLLSWAFTVCCDKNQELYRKSIWNRKGRWHCSIQF